MGNSLRRGLESGERDSTPGSGSKWGTSIPGCRIVWKMQHPWQPLSYDCCTEFLLCIEHLVKCRGWQGWHNGRYLHETSKLFSSVQSLSRVWLFATPWITAHQASLSIINSQSLLKLISIESVMPSSHLILCCLLLLLPPIPPSIRVFPNESTLRIRWPKYWSFSFSIIPSKEHSGLISFRMDWLDLLAVQGTLKSLLQHYNSKASILQHSAFFTVQLSHPYMTTGNYWEDVNV